MCTPRYNISVVDHGFECKIHATITYDSKNVSIPKPQNGIYFLIQMYLCV